MGEGLYDSQNKRVKFETDGGERIVSAAWDRKEKCLTCIVPPLTWLFGGQEIPDQELELIKKIPVRVYLTFNNQEWIYTRDFKYHDWKVERLAYCLNFADGQTPDEKERLWNAEEALDKYPETMTEEEIKKKEDEK